MTPPPAAFVTPATAEPAPSAAEDEALLDEADEPLEPAAYDPLPVETEEGWPQRSGWFRLAARISTAATVVLVIGIIWLALSFILRGPVNVGEEVDTANGEAADLPQSSNALASNDETRTVVDASPVRVIGDPWPASSGATTRVTPTSSQPISSQSDPPADGGATTGRPDTAVDAGTVPPARAGEPVTQAQSPAPQPSGQARGIEPSPQSPSAPGPDRATTANASEPDPAAPPPVAAGDDRGQLVARAPDPDEPSAAGVELVTPPLRQPPPRPASPPEPEFAAAEPEPSDVEITGTVLPGDGAGPRIVVHVPATGREAFSSRLSGALRSIGGQVEIREVGIDSRVSRVRYFYPDDRAAAQAVRRAVAANAGDWNVDLSDFTHYRPLPRRGTIEVWLTASR